MHTLSYLFLAIALLGMATNTWLMATVSLVIALLLWLSDWHNDRTIRGN